MYKITIVLLLLIQSVVLSAKEIIIFDRPLSVQYLVYITSFTKATLKTAINSTQNYNKTHWQPAGRFSAIGNSTIKPLVFLNEVSDIDILDATCTRMIINIDAKVENETWFKSVSTAKKVIKISELWEKQYHDTNTGERNKYMVYQVIYKDYKATSTNKDFWIYVVDTSTH
jgi:hypothetical protein